MSEKSGIEKRGGITRREFGVGAAAATTVTGVDAFLGKSESAALTGDKLAEAEKGTTRSSDGKLIMNFFDISRHRVMHELNPHHLTDGQGIDRYPPGCCNAGDCRLAIIKPIGPQKYAVGINLNGDPVFGIFKGPEDDTTRHKLPQPEKDHACIPPWGRLNDTGVEQPMEVACIFRPHLG